MARLAELSPDHPVLRLPHPHLTPYFVTQAEANTSDKALYRVTTQTSAVEAITHPVLHSSNVSFTEPEDAKSGERPPDTSNTPWARARRSPSFTITLRSDGNSRPTLPQVWLVIYIVFTVWPHEELFRLHLDGVEADIFKLQLKAVSLAVEHPGNGPTSSSGNKTGAPQISELLLLRSTFWQGAGSPFGPRPLWVPEDQLPRMNYPVSHYPIPPLDYHLASDPGTVLAWHPRRPVKPRPGSVIYSRWIPHLRETFNMIALDCESEEHLSLFHTWQNDPRVSQGWNITGTREQHRAYLRRAHEDPHRLTVMARFDERYFAYFEVYWAKASISLVKYTSLPLSASL